MGFGGALVAVQSGRSRATVQSGGGALVAVQSGATVERSLKRHCSAAAAANAPEFNWPSSAVSTADRKKTEQGDTLRMLKQGIDVAHLKGVWTHAKDAIRPSSVLFGTEELYKALLDIIASSRADPAELKFVQGICHNIFKFLSKLVRTSDCYPAICDVSGFFTK